jgi:hypothetical protein
LRQPVSVIAKTYNVIANTAKQSILFRCVRNNVQEKQQRRHEGCFPPGNVWQRLASAKPATGGNRPTTDCQPTQNPATASQEQPHCGSAILNDQAGVQPSGSAIRNNFAGGVAP